MKKRLLFLNAIALLSLKCHSQTVTADFETFTLSANSSYSPGASTPFQTNNATFEYEWNNSFSYWSGGFAYTNKQDSSTAGFGNMYGVKPLKGYNASSVFVIGKDQGLIKLNNPATTVNGFYLTNTTYAYKSIKLGDSFARKFGDTTGIGSGTTIAQGAYPDYFKVTIKGYKNGIMKQDSVEFYLADFRFSNSAQDYIVDTWQWVNTSSLGIVDSIRFFMYSTDIGQFGINTPLFFAMDNFTTNGPDMVGITEGNTNFSFEVYPNPFNNELNITSKEETIHYFLFNPEGRLIKEGDSTSSMQTNNLSSGIYYLKITNGQKSQTIKIIKE